MLRRFPHLATVALSYLAALLLFTFLGPEFFKELVLPFGLLGILIAGMLYTYSFTASAGAVLFVAVANDFSPGLVAVVGGAGALVSDIAIYKFIRNDLKSEVAKIGRTRLFRAIGATPILKERWFRDAVGAVVIASPLPDEIGVAMIASAKLKEDAFLYLTFIADMVGIYLLVVAARYIF